MIEICSQGCRTGSKPEAFGSISYISSSAIMDTCIESEHSLSLLLWVHLWLRLYGAQLASLICQPQSLYPNKENTLQYLLTSLFLLNYVVWCH